VLQWRHRTTGVLPGLAVVAAALAAAAAGVVYADPVWGMIECRPAPLAVCQAARAHGGRGCS
jgi:hypothetical protein